MYMDEPSARRVPMSTPGGAAEGCLDTFGRDCFPVGIVYAPVQHFRNLYDTDTALSRGTIFRELDLPFEGRSIYKGGRT